MGNIILECSLAVYQYTILESFMVLRSRWGCLQVLLQVQTVEIVRWLGKISSRTASFRTYIALSLSRRIFLRQTGLCVCLTPQKHSCLCADLM
jgi:hypothetical protein